MRGQCSQHAHGSIGHPSACGGLLAAFLQICQASEVHHPLECRIAKLPVQQIGFRTARCAARTGRMATWDVHSATSMHVHRTLDTPPSARFARPRTAEWHGAGKQRQAQLASASTHGVLAHTECQHTWSAGTHGVPAHMGCQHTSCSRLLTWDGHGGLAPFRGSLQGHRCSATHLPRPGTAVSGLCRWRDREGVSWEEWG